jgi:hypothetical protein
VSWSLRFAEPIVLADGVKLATLRQAVSHLVKTVPPAEPGSPAVLTAAELLTNAAEHGEPIDFARIATRDVTDYFGNCSVCGALIDARDLCMILAHLHGAQIEVGEGPTPPPREGPVH